MKVIYPPQHAQHAPAWYLADGSVRPCPETPARAQAILHALQATGAHELIAIAAIETRNSKVENLQALAPAVTEVHTPAYVHYLRTIHAVWHDEFQTDVLPDTFPRTRCATPPTKPAAQPGYYGFDSAAPITAGTWPAAIDSARCAISAADALLGGEKSAYALCRPPGHHAGPDYCGGFCYLNNAAIAAQHLLLAGQKKVAILDVDYHHGNGTQDIFYQRRDVLFVSIHADPNAQFPYFWGYAHETGKGAGKGFNINLPLPRKASARRWFAALKVALARITEYRPEALLVSLGADAHERDPVGDFQLRLDDFAAIGKKIKSLGIPAAFIQEGGYDLEHIGLCVGAVLSAFLARRR